MNFYTQIEYNKTKVKRMLADRVFMRTVEHAGFLSLNTQDNETINKLVDDCLARMGNTRPTSLERACVIYQASMFTGEQCSLMSGFCLRKENQHYSVDKSFHEKKSKGREHASIPNFSYCVVDGVPVGLKEPMDFIDVVEIYNNKEDI